MSAAVWRDIGIELFVHTSIRASTLVPTLASTLEIQFITNCKSCSDYIWYTDLPILKDYLWPWPLHWQVRHRHVQSYFVKYVQIRILQHAFFWKGKIIKETLWWLSMHKSYSQCSKSFCLTQKDWNNIKVTFCRAWIINLNTVWLDYKHCTTHRLWKEAHLLNFQSWAKLKCLDLPGVFVFIYTLWLFISKSLVC